MTKIRCQACKKEIIGRAKIQEFDPIEPTTIHVLYSEYYREKWIPIQEINK
ncbi:MAG: hypothetical protein ACFE9Q_08750 [Candidatus Hodarchaeota archaeon]